MIDGQSLIELAALPPDVGFLFGATTVCRLLTAPDGSAQHSMLMCFGS
jgi:hypothetical protein